jgi:hypothetical protein
MPLSPGVYKDCEVLDNWWTHAGTGTLTLAIKIAVPTEEGPQEITGKIYFTDKSMGMAYAQLREFDFDPKTQSLSEIVEGYLVGRKVTAVLEKGNRGDTKVARFGVSGGRVKPPEEQLKALDEKMRNLKKKAPVEGEEPLLDDADIPF